MASLTLQLPTRSTKYSPTALYERHQEIVRLKSLGYSNQRIADSLDISPRMVSYTLNSEMGLKLREDIQGTLNDQAAEINRRLEGLCGKAVDYMEQVVSGHVEAASPALRIKTCESILDRSGHPRVTRNEGQSVTAHLTGEDIEELKARSLRSAIDCGIVQEVQN